MNDKTVDLLIVTSLVLGVSAVLGIVAIVLHALFRRP